MESTTILAKDLRAGNLYQLEGRMFRAEAVKQTDAGVEVTNLGEHFNRYMTLNGEWEVKLFDETPDPKPFVVYTRLYKANGDCDKRIHKFATRKAQAAFVARTKRAVTFHN